MYEKLEGFGETYVKKSRMKDVALLEGLVFDMDGVLADVRDSFRKTIISTVREYFRFASIGFEFAGLEEVELFKKATGFNCDWDLTDGIILYYLSNILGNIGTVKTGPDFNRNMSALGERARGRLKAVFLEKMKSEIKKFTAEVRKNGGGPEGVKNSLKNYAEVQKFMDSKTTRKLFDEFYFGKELGEKPTYVKADGYYGNESLIMKPYYMERLTGLGIGLIGVATGRVKKELKLFQKNFPEMRKYTNNVVCADEVKKKKPEPDAILLVVKRAGLQPGEISLGYVGDNFDDIRAAKNAKMISIFIGKGAQAKRDPRMMNLFEGSEFEPDLYLPDPNYLADAILQLRRRVRSSRITRKTKETKIEINLAIDGKGDIDVMTGLPFLDHMLASLAKYAGFDLLLKAKGDLKTGAHHTVEDIAICLGKALKEASGKTGIRRIGSARVPMDDAMADVSVDVSGRNYVVAEFEIGEAGKIKGEEFAHFLDTLAKNFGITINVKITGTDSHHKAEAMFKALGLALREALKVRPGIMSTKGKMD